MTLASYVFSITAVVLVLITVLEMLRRRKLRERHTIWWILAALLGLFAVVFPWIPGGVAEFLGVSVPINLVFFIAIVVLFLVGVQQSSELTRFEERTRTLAEEVALLNDRVRQLEEANDIERDK